MAPQVLRDRIPQVRTEAFKATLLTHCCCPMSGTQHFLIGLSCLPEARVSGHRTQPGMPSPIHLAQCVFSSSVSLDSSAFWPQLQCLRPENVPVFAQSHCLPAETTKGWTEWERIFWVPLLASLPCFPPNCLLAPLLWKCCRQNPRLYTQ